MDRVEELLLTEFLIMEILRNSMIPFPMDPDLLMFLFQKVGGIYLSQIMDLIPQLPVIMNRLAMVNGN